MENKWINTLKQILWLVLVMVGSFFGVKVGNVEQVSMQTTACSINLDGASSIKRSMAGLICDSFRRITNEQAQEIMQILSSDEEQKR